ncbi:MAG TPA: hypothetical protein PKY82_34065 [Pyrinomonadaceae bacterium]|nr:hypothetical protein [Pyrinomonadaceae bacterium]
MKITFLFVLFGLAICQTIFAQSNEIAFSKSAKIVESKTEFKSGEFIFAHLKFSQPLSNSLSITDKPITLIVEYYSNGKMLDDEMFGFETANVKKSKLTSIVLPIISDPATDVPAFGKNLFSTRLPASFAKLPEGNHEIEFKLKSYEFKDGKELLASGKFTIIIESGSRAWYQQNEKDAMAAFSKRGINSVVVSERDYAMGVVGGTSVVTLINNCGKSVWLRKAIGSDKTEYRLAPGQTMKYDRDSGYLEEWNFGTKKWSIVSKIWEPDSTGRANICSK